MKLKRRDLTFIRKGRFEASSYSSPCHPHFLCLSSKIKGQLPVPWDPLPPLGLPGAPISSHRSNEMAILSMWRSSCFGGKDVQPVSKLAISASAGKTIFSVNNSRLTIFCHSSVWAVYCIFTRHERGIPCPNLQRLDTASLGHCYLCSAQGDIFGANRFSKLDHTSCQDRCPYECCELKTDFHLWFGGILSARLGSISVWHPCMIQEFFVRSAMSH